MHGPVHITRTNNLCFVILSELINNCCHQSDGSMKSTAPVTHTDLKVTSKNDICLNAFLSDGVFLGLRLPCPRDGKETCCPADRQTDRQRS